MSEPVEVVGGTSSIFGGSSSVSSEKKPEVPGSHDQKVKTDGDKVKDGEREHKHKHKKHKHKHHDHDKEKHHKSSHHDKSHKSHHHDKEKHKSSHSHSHHNKSKVPDPTRGKLGSSLLSSAKDASDISRMLAEPIDREIDSDSFNIVDSKSKKDGVPVTPKRKRTPASDGVAIPGMNVQVDKKYLVPFEQGWKREIVLRNPVNETAGASGGKPKADVYYYGPNGKKLRSLREIEDYISDHKGSVGDVTVNNFTWTKGAIYQEPGEIVRTAAGRVGKPSGDGVLTKVSKNDPNWERTKKKINQAKYSPGGPSLKSPIGKKVKMNFPSRPPVDPLKQVAKKGSGGSKGPGVMGSISMGVAKKSTAKRMKLGSSGNSLSSDLKRPSQRMCGLKCPGEEGIPPSIQCGICMCLFHASCVGHTGEVPSMYICPNCSTPEKSKNGAHKNGVNGAESITEAVPPSDMIRGQGNSRINGQLLTLPSSVLSRVNADQPISLKVNNKKLVIPPKCFLQTEEGVKVFLPLGTLPPELGSSSMKLSIENKESSQTINLLTDDEDSKDSSQGGNFSETLLPTDDTCYFDKLQIGVDMVLQIFRFLSLSDLLRASQVCHTWNKVAEHQSLWKTVHLRRVRVSQWEEAAKAFTQYGTRTLDLRGMSFYEDKNRTWHQLASVLHQMSGVRRMYFYQVPAHMLHTVVDHLDDLEGLVAERVFDADQTYKPEVMQLTKLDIGKFSKLTKLTELKVRSPHGLSLPPVSFSGGLQGLVELKNLKSLSITTLKDVNSETFDFLSSLPELEILELGECLLFREEIYAILGKLTQVKRLRLESGGHDMDGPLSNAIVNLSSLEKLELIHYQIGEKFQEAVAKLEKLEKLTVWPDGGNQAAAVNTNVLNAVKDLTRLKSLDWGMMINDGTSIFVDKDNDGSDPAEKSSKLDSDKKTDCIPFTSQKDPHTDSEGGVELMPEYTSIEQLVEKLCNFLPDTKIRVFRIPVLNAVSVVNASPE